MSKQEESSAKQYLLNKSQERVEDMHLRLSEKYQAYKSLADRCLINTAHIDKGDKRVFYLKPANNIFLEEPRKQNQFRNQFVKNVQSPPSPEPLTLFADDLYRDLLEQIQDKSCPFTTKEELSLFFKRRFYNLQHKKYKLLQRWSHYALTSELVDKVSLKFSPTYSKLQFELENAVKRQQRLEGDDHFLNVDGKPQTKGGQESSMSGMTKDKDEQLSSLRIDDIDVYLRIVTYEQRTRKEAEKFIQRVKWVPMSHRFEIFQDSVAYIQSLKQSNIEKQREHLKAMEAKGKHLIAYRKLPIQQAEQELQGILQHQHISKLDKSWSSNIKAKIIGTGYTSHELPPFMIWNELELKLQLAEKGQVFGILGDMDIDSGHSFAYNIFVFFPTYFQKQVVKSQFAVYDAVPCEIDYDELVQKVQGKQVAKLMGSQGQFINSLEKALFGEFNNGLQIKDFPSVRIKKSTWLPFICFKPSQLSKDQSFQAAALSSTNNPLDECSRNLIDLLNVQDSQNVTLVLESLSTIHHDKVRYGQIKSEFLLKSAFQTKEEMERALANDEEQVFTENEKSFLSIFSSCLIPKGITEEMQSPQPQKVEGGSLLDLPQHLLYSLFMLKYLNARDSKQKLLYTLNVFRAVQKRLTLELREMGTRDRVLGDVVYLGPMESAQQQNIGPNQNQQQSSTSGKSERLQSESGAGHSAFYESTYSSLYQVDGSHAKQKMQRNKQKGESEIKAQQVGAVDNDQVDVINDQLIDIQKIRFNGKLQNYIYSSNPILPRFHTAFGEPLDRQEISMEMMGSGSKNSDNKKEEGRKLLGRVDNVYYNHQHQVYLVKDDFNKHIMFDSSLLDMKLLEQEVLRIVSYFISKQEPLLATSDLRNTLPACDRLELLCQVLDCELSFHNAKAELVMSYLECLEHITDMLEQQRMVQVIVDVMSQRPRLNLRSTHFLEAYKAEVEGLKLQNDIVREIIRMQMKHEFQANNSIREYLERTYRLVMEQVESKWVHQKPEGLDTELKARENLQKGLSEDSAQQQQQQLQRQETKSAIKTTSESSNPSGEAQPQQQQQDQPKLSNAKFSDPKEFAAYLGIPFASLQMLMKDHKERDPLVQQTIHEHVSFIKQVPVLYISQEYTQLLNGLSACRIEEGYPIFMYDMSAKKQNNTILFTQESERIGMLDFYESLSIIVKVVAAIKGAHEELYEVHRPGDGLTATSLEICTLKYILAELKMVKGEKDMMIPEKKGLTYIEDDSIVGNPDRMLFYAKEFMASADDEQASHNPYVLTKLNLKTIDNFSFDAFQKLLLDNQAQGQALGIQDDLNKRRKIQQHHAYRFFPKLKARAQKVFIPSMLYLTCNSLEVLRLRHYLSRAILQKHLLEQVYEKQMKFLRRGDGMIYFRDSFNFQTFIELGDKNYVNFVDEGPGTGIEMPLAINEFDPSLRSLINFSDPDSFKMMISPIGLEELRITLFYELMNLQSLIIATKTNQSLLDNPMRHLAEIDLFAQGIVLPNPVYNFYARLHGSFINEMMLKKQALSERSIVLSKVQQNVGELSFNIISRKNRSKVFVQNLFNKARPEIVDPQEKHELQLRKLRTYRLSLCQDFCFDVLSELYCDSLKLQLILTTDQLRKLAYLVPRDQIFMDLGPCQHGEYRTYYNTTEVNIDYLESVRQSTPPESKTNRNLFFLEETHSSSTGINGHRIQKLWRIPTNYEIIKGIKGQFDLIRQKSFPLCYVFENPKDGAMQPNIIKNNQSKVLKGRMPKLEYYSNINEIDHVMRQKRRFVEYQYAICFEQLPLLSVLKYFTSIQNLFDLEFFQSKISSNANTIAQVEKCTFSGLPFWDISEEELMGISDQNLVQPDNTGSYVNNIGNHYNTLAAKVVERLALEKKYKLTLNQELEVIKDKFKDIEKVMMKLEMNESLDKAAAFLNEQYQISYYKLVSCLGSLIDRLSKEHQSQSTTDQNLKECLDLNVCLAKLSHLDDVKVTYTNSFHVNTSLTQPNQLNLDSLTDYHQFFRCAQPVIDERALMPSQFNLIESLYTQSQVNFHTFKKTRVYMGKVFLRDYQYLDLSLLNIDQKVRRQAMQYCSSMDQQLKEYLRVKFNATDDLLMAGSGEFYFEMLGESKTYLRTIIRARQLKRIVMILLSNSTLPISDQQELRRLTLMYNEEVQWKINTAWDEIQIDKMKEAQKIKQDYQDMKSKKGGDQKDSNNDGGFTTQKIATTLKKQQERIMSNALQQFDLSHCELEILQDEVHRFLISTSFRLLEQETSALARAYEINGKEFEYYIHPCQQFASTLGDQKMDKRHHLDTINKVSYAQRFLTQIRNRCLEIETLTSGTGVVISKKDLNECLEDACRGLLKANEIEMRTRCETHAMQLVQLENLLFVKDQQLVNLEEKLQHSQDQLDKIIRTKVFSRGKQMVYELDFSTRQLRLLKDNVFLMENRLNQQVNTAYEKELNQLKMELDECKKKFNDFQTKLNLIVTADVRDNINSIDAIMKSKADYFKNYKLHEQAQPSRQSTTTFNIGNITIKNIQSASIPPQQQQEIPSHQQQQQVHLLLIQDLELQISTLTTKLTEYDRLRLNERKAHDQILKLTDVIRKLRLMYRFKEVVQRQKHENEVDNLRAQLNNNKQLWQQLGDSQKREQIIKGELERTQQQIVVQEKIIEQLKDDQKKDKVEKAKLLQYKITKSKRLEDLETKAREFEVFSNMNLPKMIGMLESKDEQINYLKVKDKFNEAQLQQNSKIRDQEQMSYRKKLDLESRMKTEAMSKLENMRNELQLVEEGTDVGIADIWKEKCQQLVEICKSFKDENDRLQLSTNLAYSSSMQSSVIQTQNEPQLPPDAQHIGQSVIQQFPSQSISQFLNKSVNDKSSTRFKKQPTTNFDQLVRQQQQLALLQQQYSYGLNNSLIMGAPLNNLNQSVTLSGPFKGSQSVERVSSKLVQLPRLSSSNIINKGKVDPNIFSSQGSETVTFNQQQPMSHNTLAPLNTNTPLINRSTLNDQESHMSSINNPNFHLLDPMYQGGDPTKLQAYNALRQQYGTEQNVFSSLHQAHQLYGNTVTDSQQQSQQQIHPPTFAQTFTNNMNQQQQSRNNTSNTYHNTTTAGNNNNSSNIFLSTSSQKDGRNNRSRLNPISSLKTNNTNRNQSQIQVKNNVLSPPKILQDCFIPGGGLKGSVITQQQAKRKQIIQDRQLQPQ